MHITFLSQDNTILTKITSLLKIGPKPKRKERIVSISHYLSGVKTPCSFYWVSLVGFWWETYSRFSCWTETSSPSANRRLQRLNQRKSKKQVMEAAWEPHIYPLLPTLNIPQDTIHINTLLLIVQKSTSPEKCIKPINSGIFSLKPDQLMSRNSVFILFSFFQQTDPKKKSQNWKGRKKKRLPSTSIHLHFSGSTSLSVFWKRKSVADQIFGSNPSHGSMAQTPARLATATSQETFTGQCFTSTSSEKRCFVGVFISA